MTTRKVAYTTLLKEALSDFDPTTKTVDVTGPMTKQILSYKGDGELKTTSDAASILERYYFGSDDNNVMVLDEEESRTDFPEPDRNDVDDVPSDNISKTKKDIETAVKESDDNDEDDEGGEEDEGEMASESDLSEAEEAIIEKLISEMEDEDDEDEGDMGDEGDEEEDEEIDVDTQTEMGPLNNPKNADEIQEAFNIFREEIEDDDDIEDINSDDIRI